MPAPLLPLRLGFLASHGGSNLQAILDAVRDSTLPAEPCVVVSNNSQARALQRAQDFGMATVHLSSRTHPEPAALDAAMVETMRRHGVTLIVCAGYMRRVGPAMLAAYPRRILNIHPALLPRHGGQGMYGIHVHEAVLAAGDRETGATVHLVDSEYDRGPVLAQARVPVQPGDTPESLQARVLEAEHRLYPDTLRRIAAGELDPDAL